jgi:hypothetical protein
MPNQASPTSPRYTGLYNDQANGLIKLFYRGTEVARFNATTGRFESAITLEVDGAVNFDAAVDFDSTVNVQGGTMSPNLKI